jgi:hypothetical protein
MKHLVAALLLVAALPASGGPWVDPGDARLRADVELLRSNGIIIGPTDTWPLPWAQLERGLERARTMTLPPALLAAVRRIEAAAEYNRKRNRFEVRAGFTNDPALVRGFQETARGDADLAVSAHHDPLDWLTVGWGATYVTEGDTPATELGNGFRFRPVLAAIRAGNWAIYGGHVDTYWGPSNEGGLLFSTSARAFPKAGVKVLEPVPIDFPVLKWLGPVRFDMFGGVLDEERDHDNAAIIAMRLEFEPVRGVTVGLHRIMQLCGEDRPCDIGTIMRSFIGVGDADNTGTADEPGNQIAGFDLAYNFRLGSAGQGGKLFFETVAEDADNILIEQFARRGGGRLYGPLGNSGATWAAGVEYVDSLASNFFGGNKFPGSLYNHFIYTDGYTYERRPIGFSLDGDTRMLSIDGQVTDTRNRRWYASVRDVNINVSEDPRYRISLTNERFVLGTGGVEWPTRFGDLRFEGRIQTDRPDTPATTDTDVAVEFGFRSRF